MIIAKLKKSYYLLAFVLLIISSCSKQNDNEGKLIRITDGDTIVILYKGEKEKVRLIGIDTPESRINAKIKKDAIKSNKDIESIKELGKKASNYVRGKVKKGDFLKLEFDMQKRDRYGRLLAYVYLPDGKMLNEMIVKDGYAQVYSVPPNIKYADKFLRAEKDARLNTRGLWALSETGHNNL